MLKKTKENASVISLVESIKASIEADLASKAELEVTISDLEKQINECKESMAAYTANIADMKTAYATIAHEEYPEAKTKAKTKKSTKAPKKVAPVVEEPVVEASEPDVIDVPEVEEEDEYIAFEEEAPVLEEDETDFDMEATMEVEDTLETDTEEVKEVTMSDFEDDDDEEDYAMDTDFFDDWGE